MPPAVYNGQIEKFERNQKLAKKSPQLSATGVD